MTMHTKRNTSSGQATYAINGDDNTGIGSSAADTIELLAGGTVATVNSSGLTVSSGNLFLTGAREIILPTGYENEIVARVSVDGTAGSTGVFASWANPESGSITITRVTLAILTQSTGASTLDIGTTATNATTSSDNLIDGLSAAAAGVFSNATSAGVNGKAGQVLAAGKWVNVAESTGDVNGLIAYLFIHYVV